MRYPGSKRRVACHITDAFPDDIISPLFSGGLRYYCEPFFGAGSIGFCLAECTANADAKVFHVNDIDPWVCRLWVSVRDEPEALVELVRGFDPTPASFDRAKSLNGSRDIDLVRQGFYKIVLQNLSHGGLGARAGTCQGGRGQRSDHTVGSRWNGLRLARDIRRCHELMTQFGEVRITNDDFAIALDRVPPRESSFVYLDPPYYAKGHQLYTFPMADDADHLRLRDVLRKAKYRWLLSYDDHPRIRSLYSWANVGTFAKVNTMAVERESRGTHSEILISNY